MINARGWRTPQVQQILRMTIVLNLFTLRLRDLNKEIDDPKLYNINNSVILEHQALTDELFLNFHIDFVIPKDVIIQSQGNKVSAYLFQMWAIRYI